MSNQEIIRLGLNCMGKQAISTENRKGKRKRQQRKFKNKKQKAKAKARPAQLDQLDQLQPAGLGFRTGASFNIHVQAAQ